MRILNDIHIGVDRSAGTTNVSKHLLRTHILKEFKRLLPEAQDLMILGDLFDKHEIPISDLLATYQILQDWLTKGHKLVLVAGNHDLSKTSDNLSSFEFLGHLLTSGAYTSQVSVILQPCPTMWGYVIPHLPNQTMFEEALAAVPECERLFLHCNYDNFFAAQSDQSLNLSEAQATACKAEQIIIAHEHSSKRAGKVLLPGNQIASSIADWLGLPTKYYWEDGELVPVIDKFTDLIEQDWKSLEITDHRFVRVVGEATQAEAAQVVSAISKFRAKSPALVVSNSVNLALDDGLGDFARNLEAVTAFDVWKALGEVLQPADMAILKGLE